MQLQLSTRLARTVVDVDNVPLPQVHRPREPVAVESLFVFFTLNGVLNCTSFDGEIHANAAKWAALFRIVEVDIRLLDFLNNGQSGLKTLGTNLWTLPQQISCCSLFRSSFRSSA